MVCRASTTTSAPIFLARSRRNGWRSEARIDEAPDAFAMATVNSPTGPQPSTATERPERSCSLVANTALPNGSWSVAISGGSLLAVRLPDHRLGHGHVAREGAVAVDAEDLGAFAEVAVAGAAGRAGAARDVALGRDEVADRRRGGRLRRPRRLCPRTRGRASPAAGCARRPSRPRGGCGDPFRRRSPPPPRRRRPSPSGVALPPPRGTAPARTRPSAAPAWRNPRRSVDP